MELSSYIGQRVKIELTNGFLYEGVVLDVDDDSLVLNDKFGKKITFSKKSIFSIREDSKCLI